MRSTTSPLTRWQRWRPFGIAKRVLTLTLALLTVSSLLAFDAVADDSDPDLASSGAAGTPDGGPRPEIAPTVGLVIDDSARLAATLPEARAERRQEERQQQREERRTLWFRLADCESGFRDGGEPIAGSARWDYGLNPSHDAPFEGGLQFAPFTWDAFRDADMPDHAGDATPAQQVAVAERVLAAQGWRAWPVCSRMLGLRA